MISPRSNHRHYSWIDHFCLSIDQCLRLVTHHIPTTHTSYPAQSIPLIQLPSAEKHQVARLMRVNHSGEICARALYYGQILASHSNEIRDHLWQAALEEGDHIHWCAQRLIELNSPTSCLNVLWYISSLGIGILAGCCGDQWSLGFIAETERQVSHHLDGHLECLPEQDQRSHAILTAMKKDEMSHCQQALSAGGAHNLPCWACFGMRIAAKIMVITTYWI